MKGFRLPVRRCFHAAGTSRNTNEHQGHTVTPTAGLWVAANSSRRRINRIPLVRVYVRLRRTSPARKSDLATSTGPPAGPPSRIVDRWDDRSTTNATSSRRSGASHDDDASLTRYCYQYGFAP